MPVLQVWLPVHLHWLYVILEELELFCLDRSCIPGKSFTSHLNKWLNPLLAFISLDPSQATFLQELSCV